MNDNDGSSLGQPIRPIVDPIPTIAQFFAQRGYQTETPRLGATLFVTRKGHSAGIFLPYVDFVFVHDLDAAAGDPQTLERLHGDARSYAATQFRLPRALRYRIPNVVTLGVTQRDGSSEAIAFAQQPKQRHQTQGGEKDSAFVLDMQARRLYSAGLEQNPSQRGGSNTWSVNPTNRVFRLLTELAEELFGS